jgi:hypothetical protein
MITNELLHLRAALEHLYRAQGDRVTPESKKVSDAIWNEIFDNCNPTLEEWSLIVDGVVVSAMSLWRMILELPKIASHRRELILDTSTDVRVE